MSAIADITLNDGQDTPVAHTFNHVHNLAGTYTYRESGTASVLGAAVIYLTRLKVKGNSSLEKTRVKVFIPALETVTGQNYEGYTAQPRLAYSLNFVGDFTAPLRASAAQKKDLVAYTKNLLANAQVTDAITASLMPY